MSELSFPKKDWQSSDFKEIKNSLEKYGVFFDRWEAKFPLKETDDQERILSAYEDSLKPFMEKNGFQSADVINVHPGLENKKELRRKFIREHTHSEDEIRFFVDGSGTFYFHFDDDQVARLVCCQGDFLAVPAGFKHWFDLEPDYFVKAIRIFSNQEGWVAKYTDSKIEEAYVQV